MRGKILVLVLGILLVVPLVYSASITQPSQQFNKLFLDPFYRSSMDRNVPYTYTLNIDPADGMSSVESAIINFQMWLNPTIEFFLTVDGQTCNNPSYLVHTTYAGAGEGNIFFDCSNVITKAGTYEVVLTPDDDTGAITSWADITYTNNPKATVEVHGTEYEYGRDPIAKVWLQLLNSTGGDVETGVCYADIYTPDGSNYIEDALMTNMEHEGIYYYDTPTPIGTGVYPVIAKCFYDATQSNVLGSSYTVYEGQDKNGGDVTRSWIDDGAFFEVQTDNNIRTTNQLDMNVTFGDFYNNCSGVSEDLLTSVSIFWKGKWETGDINHNIMIYFFNYTSNDWVELPNVISGGNGGTIFSTGDSITVNNITTSLGITSTNPLVVRYNDTLNTEGSKKFKTYYTYASCSQLANPEWEEVKGSSEMHVSSEHQWAIEITSGQIRNDTFPDFFYYNFTVESGVGVDTNDVEVQINMPKPFSCHHINNLTIDGVQYNFTLSNTENDALSKGCKVDWNQDLNVGQNYQGQIVADNWFKELEVMWLTEMQIQRQSIGVVCENYQIEMGYDPYVLPRPDDENPFDLLSDQLYDVCYAYLDVYHHYNQSYFEEYYTPSGTFSADDMLLLDNMYIHMVEGRDELNLIAQTILTVLNAIDSYSLTLLADPNNLTSQNWSGEFAQISTSYLNYLSIQGVPTNTWDYSNRSLTYYADASNSSAIAEAVWNWDGTIVANILNQITNSIWSYTGSIVGNILDTFSISIWNATDRNLTYSEPPETDYERIYDGVWNSSNRYTHGIVI